MTQQQLVSEVLSDGPLSIKEVSDVTGIKEPNIRRILGQGTLKGKFTRVRPGVYTLISDDSKAIFINGDAFEEIKKIKGNFDLVFLDIPYKTIAVTGGNRGIKYETISPKQLSDFIVLLKNLIHQDTYIVHCYSNAPSGWKQMKQYNDQFDIHGFTCVSKNKWQKLFGNGKLATNMRGDVMPPESLDIYSLSGKQIDFSKTWTLPKTSVASQKNPEIIKDIFGFCTKVGSWIFDPFTGSGIAALVAIQMNRNVVAIEKSEERFNTEIIYLT